MVGHNTVAAEQLRTVVERIEEVRRERKELADHEGAIKAEAKAAGFIPKAIMHVVKLRAMKPVDRRESEAIIDTYLHALGELPYTPLHEQVGLIKADIAKQAEVVEAMKAFVPANGSITVDVAGLAMRLTRDENGDVAVSEVVEKPFAPVDLAKPVPGMHRAPPPMVDGYGAELLGREAFKANEPIIKNPFPFGDDRRPRWDEGWRKESGSDGMGPGGKP